jgi:hypothetical protein
MAQADSIRRAMHAQPFRPYGIKLVDGSIHTVRHPDFVAISPGRRPRELTFYVDKAGGTGDADNDETHWIDLALVLEVIVPQARQLGRQSNRPTIERDGTPKGPAVAPGIHAVACVPLTPGGGSVYVKIDE